jgi:putative endonuclease
MTETARDVGAFGERLAERFLVECGMTILDRNWRCSHGELDLVAREGDCLVFCEVKTRRGTAFGEPVEAVSWRKAARLRRLTAAWLASHGQSAGAVRIDVVGILVRPGRLPIVRHIAGVGS